MREKESHSEDEIKPEKISISEEIGKKQREKKTPVWDREDFYWDKKEKVWKKKRI